MPAAAQESPEAAPPREGEWSVRWDDHPEVEWSGRLRVEFRARLQGDSRASRAAVERLEGDAFDIGRRRIGIAGEIGGTLEFQIERELEDSVPWRDVYVNYRPTRGAAASGGSIQDSIRSRGDNQLLEPRFHLSIDRVHQACGGPRSRHDAARPPGQPHAGLRDRGVRARRRQRAPQTCRPRVRRAYARRPAHRRAVPPLEINVVRSAVRGGIHAQLAARRISCRARSKRARRVVLRFRPLGERNAPPRRRASFDGGPARSRLRPRSYASATIGAARAVPGPICSRSSREAGT